MPYDMLSGMFQAYDMKFKQRLARDQAERDEAHRIVDEQIALDRASREDEEFRTLQEQRRTTFPLTKRTLEAQAVTSEGQAREWDSSTPEGQMRLYRGLADTTRAGLEAQNARIEGDYKKALLAEAKERLKQLQADPTQKALYVMLNREVLAGNMGTVEEILNQIRQGELNPQGILRAGMPAAEAAGKILPEGQPQAPQAQAPAQQPQRPQAPIPGLPQILNPWALGGGGGPQAPTQQPQPQQATMTPEQRMQAMRAMPTDPAAMALAKQADATAKWQATMAARQADLEERTRYHQQNVELKTDWQTHRKAYDDIMAKARQAQVAKMGTANVNGKPMSFNQILQRVRLATEALRSDVKRAGNYEQSADYRAQTATDAAVKAGSRLEMAVRLLATGGTMTDTRTGAQVVVDQGYVDSLKSDYAQAQERVTFANAVADQAKKNHFQLQRELDTKLAGGGIVLTEGGTPLPSSTPPPNVAELDRSKARNQRVMSPAAPGYSIRRGGRALPYKRG